MTNDVGDQTLISGAVFAKRYNRLPNRGMKA